MFFEKGLGSFRQQKNRSERSAFLPHKRPVQRQIAEAVVKKSGHKIIFFIIFLPNVLCISKITITFAQQF